MPYQGSKWRFRSALINILTEVGFDTPPTYLRLYDVGPMQNAVRRVLNDDDRKSILYALVQMAKRDPREEFDRLQNLDFQENSLSEAAATLFLQRLAFSGKAVGREGGRLKSPGFNDTSAYGTPATKLFGAVRPMVQSLIETLEKAPSTTHLLDIPPGGTRSLVYLDPPYQGTTKYPNGDMSREQVVLEALAYARLGRAVLVSEAEPVSELVKQGWKSVQIAGPSDTGSPFKSKKPEWVTYTPETTP